MACDDCTSKTTVTRVIERTCPDCETVKLPSGGQQGDHLAKGQFGLVWDTPESGGGTVNIDFEDIIVPITTTNQTVFTNVIPENRTFYFLFINGVKYFRNIDYTVTGRTIQWVSPDFSLDSTLQLSITVNKYNYAS